MCVTHSVEWVQEEEKGTRKCVPCDSNEAWLTSWFFLLWPKTVSIIPLYAQKPKSVPKKISAQMNYRILHKGRSPSITCELSEWRAWPRKPQSPCEAIFSGKWMPLTPAAVAKSMFERGGQKTALGEGCLHNEEGCPGSTLLWILVSQTLVHQQRLHGCSLHSRRVAPPASPKSPRCTLTGNANLK